MDKTLDGRATVSAMDARGARVVKGGAIRRILLVSLTLAIAALLLVYLYFFFAR